MLARLFGYRINRRAILPAGDVVMSRAEPGRAIAEHELTY